MRIVVGAGPIVMRLSSMLGVLCADSNSHLRPLTLITLREAQLSY